ncbi:MAG TPA: fasciclin domain-containing protein [Flavobacteriaceae bacterium]|nr:fasciclin [Flavobacteriaceae bacterium]MAY54131.1 fasciclin [Flavobacteriaceae bacterium]HBR54760.1 fasciclin [Flavobacteriaceae bacterium]HIB48419.1 fasciclin domain-containing protein [Flavobacteriaceae bacterium]HIN98277.1 fasciclin domain-containing protein [Flavobacteriaceae bacterium]
MSLAVVAMLFAACDDGKKKEAEAKAEQEKMEMEAKMKADEEAKMMEAEKMKMRENSIASIAMKNENFSTLVAALKQADLATTFMEEGEYTVFAPTNDAFAAVPAASMDMLMNDDNKAKLQNLLKYHVVSGEWKADAVIKAINDNNNAYNVTTLAGENLVLSLKDGKVMVKDGKGKMATVVMADVDASNGVIHAIDKVVMPKG